MSQQFLPLLKPQNIDELKSLILEIMEDNDSKLDKLIQNKQNEALEQGNQFTIQDLNDLLSQQCLQRQKIISNLSHFSLSLMNTIQVLWQDNQDLEYRIKDQRQVIQQMSNHLQQISKQGDHLKNKLHLAYNDIHKIQQEKHAIQEYLSSIIVKHDSSFSLKQNKRFQYESDQKRKFSQNNFDQRSFVNQENQNQLGNCFIADGLEKQNKEPNQLEQNSMSGIQKQHKQNQHYQMNLLQESLIKDSISVLRRYTLQDQVCNMLPILQQSQNNIKFIDKSHRFSLINQISLQIFQQPKNIQPVKQQPVQQLSFTKAHSQQKSTLRDLRISNEKINLTIGTGTQFTKTKDSSKAPHQQFSMIQPNQSCGSFLLQRQSSAIMYPCLERSSSNISFVTHTTKQIQTDLYPPKLKQIKKKDFKLTERKTADASTMMEQPKITKKIIGQKQINRKVNTEPSEMNDSKIQQNSNRKSFSQLLNYFTKKIVSDRIKTTNKKNDLGGFKKTKSNIQKVF